MTTENRLARAASDAPVRVIAPKEKDERVQFWIDRGNRILWGQEPTSKGDYLDPKPHLHWRHHDGHYWIEERA